MSDNQVEIKDNTQAEILQKVPRKIVKHEMREERKEENRENKEKKKTKKDCHESGIYCSNICCHLYAYRRWQRSKYNTDVTKTGRRS